MPQAFHGNAYTERLPLKLGSNAKTTTAQYKVGYISAANTVSIVDTTSAYKSAIGIIETYPSASSEVGSVIIHGITKAYCNASVTAGDAISPAGTGKIQTFPGVNLTTGSAATATGVILGYALENGSTNQAITIYVNPQFVLS